MMQQCSAQSILKNIFGFDEFRGKQAEIIDRLVAGDNILTVMPTGAGKSLCFQIPALMKEGLTIVVSPLISLMQNQVDALKILGVEAATLNSHNTDENNHEIWLKIRNGMLKLLYVSPEKLMTPSMLEMIEEFTVNYIAIDEAHCISQWGAAFRPEYEELSLLHTRFPTIPIIALTATADSGTRAEICEKIFSNNVQSYLAGFDRPNISLNVEIKKGWKQQLLHFLKGRQSENGIVYCLSRKKTEDAAKTLREKGYNALPYHAGLPSQTREENLNRFMAEPDLIIVATIAFGMGIDKADIRFVFHTDLPSSPEAYYQEIGRAGRDGKPAVAYMLYGMDDIRMRRMFIDNEDADISHKRRGHHRLNSLLSFCEAPECRRISLLRYFGDEVRFTQCNNCDLCNNPRDLISATEAGQKFLSAIYRTGQSFGAGHIIDILTGKMTDKVERLRHNELPTFGVGQEFTLVEWKTIARQLMARGFILSDMEFGSLKITDQGTLLLKGQEKFSYRPDVISKKMVVKKAGKSVLELPNGDQSLFQSLKSYRKEIAAERGVPAFIIFTDKSLIDMAINKPTNMAEFGEIFGIGEGKKKEFGKQFIDFLQEHRD